MARLDWQHILERAAGIVMSYSTGVTLRQLFYRLVSAHLLPNTQSAYKGLSSKSAGARRQGRFPDLLDRTRTIHGPMTFESPTEARQWLARLYRRDRTEFQDVSLYLGVEKNGMVEQLTDWYADLGIPILALGGYASQTYADEVARDIEAQERPAILLYAGDFDPSGEDIPRDFVERVAYFDEVRRIALSAEQVAAYNLPPQLGKTTDSRANGFIKRHGQLVQVELDALDPDDLRDLYQSAIDEYWDVSAYEESLAQEAEERKSLI